MKGERGFRVEAGLDGTRIYARRPGRTDPGAALLKLSLLLVVWTALMGGFATGPNPPVPIEASFVSAAATILAFLSGLVLRWVRPPPPAEYEILLDPRGVSVDGQRMAHDVKMTLHAEKLVFRDAERQVEVWHGIHDLDERMELRTLLERALEASSERHGDGAEAVPDQLRTRQVE